MQYEFIYNVLRILQPDDSDDYEEVTNDSHQRNKTIENEENNLDLREEYQCLLCVAVVKPTVLILEYIGCIVDCHCISLSEIIICVYLTCLTKEKSISQIPKNKQFCPTNTYNNKYKHTITDG